jgi:hypothetical protein
MLQHQTVHTHPLIAVLHPALNAQAKRISDGTLACDISETSAFQAQARMTDDLEGKTFDASSHFEGSSRKDHADSQVSHIN